MPLYDYQGRNRRGEMVAGRVEAASLDGVAEQLRGAGVTPLKIAAAARKEATEPWYKRLDEKLQGSKVELDELIILSRQMYSLNKAGVPIIRAIRGLSESVPNLALKRTLKDIAEKLETGIDLASCFKRHPKVFSDFYVSIIHVGENTGRLDEAFRRVAGYLELERETIKRMKGATRYPLFVMVTIAVAIGVINVMVIPAFATLFEGMGASLPWQTQVLLATSNFTVDYWPFLLGLIVTLVVGFKYYVKTERGHYHWDRVKLKLPLIGSIFERINLGRFARSFSMLLRAGVPLVQALTVVSNALGNVYLGERIRSMRNGIERGESFSRVAGATGMFSPLIMQMIAVGEETGNMDELLDEAADFYEQEVDYDLKVLSDRIEPILMMVVAGIVLILALGVFLPMWDLSSAVKRG